MNPRSEIIAGHSRGWSFTRLNGKIPTLKGWQSADRAELETVLGWHDAGHNVGIRTGAASGIVIIDADEGSDLEPLDLPETVTASTGTGRHYYYSQPDGVTIRNSAGKLGPHIDVRGEAGQCVFVGSVHETGTIYEWLAGRSPDDIPIVELPEAIVERLTAGTVNTNPTPTLPAPKPQNPPMASQSRLGATALARETAAVASSPEGTRNHALNVASFNLGQLCASGDLTEGEARTALTEAARQAGLPEQEIQATLDSGISAGRSEPRSARTAAAPTVATANVNLTVTLDNETPYAKAGLFLHERHSHADGPTLRWHRSEFFAWDGRAYRTIPEADLRAIALAWLAELDHKPTPRKASDIVSSLAAICRVSHDIESPTMLDGSDGDCIALQNGLVRVVDLVAGGDVPIREHTPRWFSTSALPYRYDPGATCPRWLAFLNEMLEGDEDRISLLQQWTGYQLVADSSLHKFLLLEGEGSNGKGVVLDVLGAIVGEQNVCHVPLESFGQRFALWPTVGKLSNLVAEVGELGRADEGIFKSFVAGDGITIDRKNLPVLQCRPTARITIACNKRPRWADRSDGIWRRLLLLPFRVQVPEDKQDRRLAKTIIKTELPGIFNWGIAGLQELRANGGFIVPEVCAEAAAEYRIACNPARAFLLDNCSPSPGEGMSCTSLYAAYRRWSDENGHRPMASPQFGHEVRRVFPAVGKVRTREGDSREWRYSGIQLST